MRFLSGGRIKAGVFSQNSLAVDTGQHERGILTAFYRSLHNASQQTERENLRHYCWKDPLMMFITSYLVLFLAQEPPAGPPPPKDEVISLPSRNFDFPLLVDPARKDEIKEIHLFESWDKGKT